MSVTIYHNPRCSKSRQTLQLLQDKGIEPTIVEYLELPPDAVTLDAILKQLDMEPRDLMRQKEPEYETLNLGDPGLSREVLIQAMVEHPMLIERPIVVANKKAALGRPPENVLEIL
jgi:arsenate reductase